MLIFKQFIDTYTCLIPACNISSSMNMAWLLLCEFLLFTKFVSLSVIPENRKNIYNTKKLSNEKYFETEEESNPFIRQKRNAHYSEEEDDEEWDPICRSFTETTKLQPLLDEQNYPVLSVVWDGTSKYTHFVETKRCHESSLNNMGMMVGGIRVKCVQKYSKHTVVIRDKNTGQERYRRPYFLPSGCEAQMAP